jgi:hypothetical protein
MRKKIINITPFLFLKLLISPLFIFNIFLSLSSGFPAVAAGASHPIPDDAPSVPRRRGGGASHT